LIALFATVSLAAAPSPVALAVEPITGPTLKPEDLSYYSLFFANQLRARGVQLDGVEQPDAKLVGRFGPFGGSGLQVDVTVTKADTGEVIAARSVSTPSEGAVLELLRRTAQELAVELFHRFGKMPVPQQIVPLPPRLAARADGPSPSPGLITAVAGIAVAAGGVLAISIANQQLGLVRGGQLDPSAEQGAKTLSTVGVVLLAVGGAALVGGVAYALIASKGNASLTLRVAPTPYGFALGGSF
jgi:hypothetical protein